MIGKQESNKETDSKTAKKSNLEIFTEKEHLLLRELEKTKETFLAVSESLFKELVLVISAGK